MHFEKIRGVGGICPPITLILKKSTRAFDYQANEPPSEVYTSTLSKPCKPLGYNSQPLPRGLLGAVILKDLIPIFFGTKYLSQNFWLDVFGEMMGMGGEFVALQSHSTIKRGTSSINFQLNELFLKFLRQLLRYEASWSKKIIIIIIIISNTLCQHRSLLRLRYCSVDE